MPRRDSDTICKGDLNCGRDAVCEHEVDQVREPETMRQKVIMLVNAISVRTFRTSEDTLGQG